MGEEAKTDNRNIHGMILVVLGIIAVIAGVAIINVRGNFLRGSGAGTASIILGIFLLLIAGLRLFYKKP